MVWNFFFRLVAKGAEDIEEAQGNYVFNQDKIQITFSSEELE